ncbi:serine/threonine protein kinase [Thermococcus sp.]|uniref:serine/threonine protein kinase n=1 Tax=Thermococcus sp. TaxID=35749 RepID=UPI00260B551A|nr:serine/threonine protein kinase [Thermococcus sp.]
MFDHIISGSLLEDFLSHLKSLGITEVKPYSKGTTGLVFLGEMDGKRVVIKLQRPDSPRQNFKREAELVRVIEPFGVTPPLFAYGRFENLDYIIREFAKGEIILQADLERRHIFKIVEKTALLDRLGLDHGQIQGGKHIIIGEDVYIIDFEKAGWRKPKNLTSAIAMLFLNDNIISKRLRKKFGVDEDFLLSLRGELTKYKRTGRLSNLLSLLSSL